MAGFPHVVLAVRTGERVLHIDRINGRIQIVAEIQPDGPDRRMVPQAETRRMGKVAAAADALLPGRGTLSQGGSAGYRSLVPGGDGQDSAGVPVGLPYAQCTGPDVSRVGEDVAHVVEKNEADRIPQPWQVGGRQAKLGTVHQGTGAADRKTGFRIARACGVDGKAAQGSRTSRVEPFRQRNELIGALTERPLLRVAGIAREHEAVFLKAEEARIGEVQTIEFGLRSEGVMGKELLEARVGAPVRVQWRVAGV